MARSSCFFLLLLLCAFVVEGTFISEVIRRTIDEEKSAAKEQAVAAASKAKNYAQDVMLSISDRVTESESWLDSQVQKEASTMTDPCKPDIPATKKTTHTSLWKCLQMARVVTDGTDIAAKGFDLASDILETADDSMQSITACIIGPMQSTSQLVACYLSAIGTLGSGIAQNIEQVEHYITVVKRDVLDIHGAIDICRNQTVEHTVQNIHEQHKECQKKNKIH